MKPLPLLALPLLLAACSPQSDNDYAVMARFDPQITTIPVEVARNTARYADDTVQLSTGKYCQGFLQNFGPRQASARLELTLLPQKRYQLAGRYTYNGLVRTYNQIGNYVVRGHALTFVNQAGEETTWPITRADTDSIQVWGNLPMTRSACTSAPLEGAAFQEASRKAREEQRQPAPWADTGDNVN